MIKLEKINKSYGSHQVIKDLSLEIQDKETLILLGESGCGKTTILKMINKLISKDSGNIYIGDQNIDDIDVITLRRQIGYVFQNIGLLPHYSIKGNLCIVPHLLKWPKETINSQLKTVCEMLQIDSKLLKRKPSQLSGGQRQRVGVGRALMGNPDIVLMDEPFGALDPITRTQIQDEFLTLTHIISKTIVFVTHDVHEAFTLGDKICIFDAGNIVQNGTKEDILYKPKNAFVKKFIERHFDSLKKELS